MDTVDDDCRHDVTTPGDGSEGFPMDEQRSISTLTSWASGIIGNYRTTRQAQYLPTHAIVWWMLKLSLKKGGLGTTRTPHSYRRSEIVVERRGAEWSKARGSEASTGFLSFGDGGRFGPASIMHAESGRTVSSHGHPATDLGCTTGSTEYRR